MSAHLCAKLTTTTMHLDYDVQDKICIRIRILGATKNFLLPPPRFQTRKFCTGQAIVRV